MQAPTPVQITQVQNLMGQANNNGILAFLQANPTVDVNTIRDRQTDDTLYMEVMFDARITVDSPLFIEVMRRKPDPYLKNTFGQTALDQVKNRYYQFRDQRFLDKYRVAKQYEDSFVKSQARNLSALLLSGKNALGQLPTNASSSSTTTTTSSSSQATPRRVPIPQNAENKITEFLTGIKGPTATKMSQLRVKAGLSGVNSGTQGGSRKTNARKIKSRSSKKKKTFKRKQI